MIVELSQLEMDVDYFLSIMATTFIFDNGDGSIEEYIEQRRTNIFIPLL